MAKINDIDSALASFEEAVNKYGIATENGDSKTGNKNYDKAADIVTWIKSQNKIDHLLTFLNHSNEAVKMTAAFYLLEDYEKEAVKALEEVKEADGFFSFIAETTMEEWKSGNLS